MSEENRKPEGDFVAVLGKTFRVLNAFTISDVWLGSTEIAARAGIPKPTASRLAKSLAALNQLHYSSRRRKYRLGTGVLALGYAARAESGLVALVRPYLQQLADTHGVHASLAERDHTDVVQLEVAHSSNTPMTLRLEAGFRIPVAGTATGHAFLATLADGELELLLQDLAARHQKHWPEVREHIAAGVRQLRATGYTTSQRGWHTDINGVAAPLILPGLPTRVLSCSAPARHLPRKKMDEIGVRLVQTAAEIADAFGGAGVTGRR